MNDELKDFCVICLAECIKASTYASVYVPKDTVVVLTNGWQIHLRGESDTTITTVTAGRPEFLAEFARILGKGVGRYYINQFQVGVWAQLEWFGLRICFHHMWKAQELWERGGNRNWRP